MKREIAEILLNTKAVKLDASNPFTYASGIKSPIYCDNRILIGKKERDRVVELFLQKLGDYDFQVVCGTATAGIPWAAIIADRLNKPLAYVRGKKKEHGKAKVVEGAEVKGKKVILIEDLISTGGSSIKAAESLAAEGALIHTIVAIFTYQFKSSAKNALQSNLEIVTLSDFSTLIALAKERQYLSCDQYDSAKLWSLDPEGWWGKISG